MALDHTCPYCAEEIAPEAVRCPHCRSHLVPPDPGPWYRDLPERRLAGVAALVGRAFGAPVGTVRLGFIVLTFVHLIGPVLYAAIWLAVPFAAGDESLAERCLGRARDLVRELRTSRTMPGDPHA